MKNAKLLAVFMAVFIAQFCYGNDVKVTTDDNDECAIASKTIEVKPFDPRSSRTLKLKVTNGYDSTVIASWGLYDDDPMTTKKIKKGETTKIEIKVDKDSPSQLKFSAFGYYDVYTIAKNLDYNDPTVQITHYTESYNTITVSYSASDKDSKNYAIVSNKPQISLARVNVEGANGYEQTIYQDHAENVKFVNLKTNTKYKVSVTVIDYAGKTSVSEPLYITTAPLTPSGLKVTPSYETATLSWNAVSGAVRYYIYKGNSLVKTVTGTSYTIQGLSIGITYNDNYYVVAENSAGTKSGKSKSFGSFTTKGLEITGPDGLCTKASYAIKDYNSSLFSVSKWSCSTSTVKATNGNGYSIELQKVTDGNGWISFTLKSKSTQKEYTIKKSFVVGTPNPGFNIPTNVYTGERNVISVKNKNYSTYDWNINMSRIVSGQGTSQITFIVEAQTPAPRDYVTMANDEVTNDNTNNYRSTIVRAVKPLPTTNKVKGKLTVSNTCGSATYDFNITFSTKWLARALPDSLDVQLFSEDIPLAIESESASYDESFVIYPNPASSVINIRQPYDKESIKTIDIFDATGKKCISEVFGNNDSFTTVDISALPKGTYILIVNQNENAQAGTFIKQ